jgi:hypothetical protein
MIGRLFTLAVILGAGYWYWSGPYQDRVNPSYEQKLEHYAEEMRQCIRGVNYRAGTGANTGDPEKVCAQRLNLYRHEGRWHSYDDVRRQ